MTIYLDVIWFLNFCIDVLLLYITAIALKRNVKHWRLIVAGLFASSIVLLLFTPLGSLFYKPWMKLLFSLTIVFIAFGFKRLPYFLQNFFMFYFVTFMTGGGLFALHFFWQSDVEVLEGVMISKTTGYGSTFSWLFVLIGFPLVWYFSKQQINQIEVKQVQYDQLTEVEISFGEKLVHVKGLIDSGNQLHDPITRVPVMILEARALQSILSDEMIATLSKVEEIGMMVDHPFAERMRIVPYRVVGHDQQFLIALKPDYVKIKSNEEEHQIKKVLVGINHSNLSNDGDYQCIVHPKLILTNHGKKLA
ncbi:sigma-E processing peptidase SpoIIGA [Bacillus alkalicellulosilyticus]|uniref:sigma-E processing peptidase SpoIIGA n=1 Tax=Alkalihalobacterium alkalicellulosilyticum TaxID=1912214 RepID=UPI000996B0F6|nr:sigma-E processing peptidase SpoIIGA [Bacillus alkalicellulosilyticus]